MEQKVTDEIHIHTSTGDLSLRIGGTIDRMDSKNGTLRIVDYKTGGTPKTPTDIAQLFQPSDDRPANVFQTFLYAYILCRKQPMKVMPALLYIHRAASEDYLPVIEMGAAKKRMPVDDFTPYASEFHEHLQHLLQEIFGTERPFTQTENRKRCAYCDYQRLCRR